MLGREAQLVVVLDVVHEGLVSENHAACSTVQGAVQSSRLGCEVLHLDGNHHSCFTFGLLRRAGGRCCRAAFCSLWTLGGIVTWLATSKACSGLGH